MFQWRSSFELSGAGAPRLAHDASLPQAHRFATAFVWGIWVLMLLATLTLIVAYGNHVVPHGDELYLFGGKYSLDVKRFADDPMTRTPSLTFAWVWEQHAEHRIPLAKFIWLGVLKLTDFDFFVGNVIVVMAFGVVAAPR